MLNKNVTNNMLLNAYAWRAKPKKDWKHNVKSLRLFQ